MRRVGSPHGPQKAGRPQAGRLLSRTARQKEHARSMDAKALMLLHSQPFATHQAAGLVSPDTLRDRGTAS